MMVDLLSRYSYRRNMQHYNCNIEVVDRTLEDCKHKIDFKVWKLGSASYSNSWVYSFRNS